MLFAPRSVGVFSAIYLSLLLLPSASGAIIQVTNFGELLNQLSGFGNATGLNAVSFTTDDSYYTLGSVTSRFDNSGGATADIGLQLYSDSGGVPGSFVEDLGVITVSQTNPAIDLTFASVSSVLSPNTTYWSVFSSTGLNNVLQVGTSSTGEVSPGSWLIGQQTLVSRDGGGSWNGFIPAFALSVNATNIPEPSGFALLSLGTLSLLCRRRRRQAI